MSVLGIYFGPGGIHLVETDGKRVLNNIKILAQRFSASDSEFKVPDGVRMATVIKEELSKNQIAVKEANIVLLGRDLIVRTFHMPVLPQNELYNAVRFEAKKYIPFKVEDLVSDFQTQFDKSNHKNFILFVGIKKESLDKYLSVFTQLGIKVNSIEYAGYSILRLLKLAKLRESGIVAVVNADLAAEDEVNFIVLENGFPLFSRDIILGGESAAMAVQPQQPLPVSLVDNLEKLKVELRISFDFYLRKFPTKNIKNVVFISSEEYRAELEAFIKERGLNVQFVASKKFVDIKTPFSLSFFKAYASSLAKVIKTNIKVDLLPQKKKGYGKPGEGAGLFDMSSLAELKINSRMVLLGLIIIVLPFLADFYLKKPVKEELVQIINSREQVPSVSATMSYGDLTNVLNQYQQKLKVIKDLLRRRIFITEPLDALPRVLPRGIWLNEITFKSADRKLVLNLQGSVYLDDSDQEFLMINKFLGDLQGNSVFSKHFSSMNIVSMDQSSSERGGSMTNFVIVCRSE
ncbi:MAG: pilus assembly protein PilM [Candidatus Omnitrophica bacterium]|nr:pilus assembly protein PilM [Candidatus Omnitrophota bacterium]